MSLLELYELNPWLEKREKTLQIGEKLVVEKLIPELSIVNCYKATEINSIPPEVVYQEDNTIYSGLTVIAEEGEEGKDLENHIPKWQLSANSVQEYSILNASGIWRKLNFRNGIWLI